MVKIVIFIFGFEIDFDQNDNDHRDHQAIKKEKRRIEGHETPYHRP